MCHRCYSDNSNQGDGENIELTAKPEGEYFTAIIIIIIIIFIVIIVIIIIIIIILLTIVVIIIVVIIVVVIIIVTIIIIIVIVIITTIEIILIIILTLMRVKISKGLELGFLGCEAYRLKPYKRLTMFNCDNIMNLKDQIQCKLLHI